jgi:hypothetical protein
MLTIDIPYTNVNGVEFALIASGLPMNPDSDPKVNRSLTKGDWKRIKNLADAKPASGHDCALKGITVKFYIKAPQYWWMQAERYNWLEIVSSQSKMHMLTNMELDYQVNEWVEQDTLDRLKEAIELFNNWDKTHKWPTIHSSELVFESKDYLRQYIISNCPMGLQLTAGITTNYLQLKTVYNQRRNHKLKEWQEFCDWIEESLPNSELITGKKEN